MAIITEHGVHGESFSVDPDRREFSFTTTDGVYKGDLLPVMGIGYAFNTDDPSWTRILIEYSSIKESDELAIPVHRSPFWEKFVTVMQSAINKRTTIAPDDITIKAGDCFKDSQRGHLYRVTSVNDSAVTLLNNNTGAVYTVPVFMLTGQGYLLSFSYRFPY